MGIGLLERDPILYITWIIIVMFSICVHEFAHAYTAYLSGDHTAARRGHLSFNPWVQMGPVSIVMLFMLGIAWGAVPVDRSQMRHRYADALISMAGPASNFMLAVAFGLAFCLLAVFLPQGQEQFMALGLCRVGAYANCALGIFNLMPVPPLDGWSVIYSVVPAARRVPEQRLRVMSLVFILLVFLTPLNSVFWSTGDRLTKLILRGWGMIFGFEV